MWVIVLLLYRVGPHVHSATLVCVYPILLEAQQQPDSPPIRIGNGEHRKGYKIQKVKKFEW